MRSKFLLFTVIMILAFCSAYGQDNPPVLDQIGNINSKIGFAVSIDVTSSDADDDAISLGILPSPVPPAGFVFTDNGDGTGHFEWTPVAAGEFVFSFYAQSNDVLVQEFVTITVDTEPILDPIGAKTVTRGQNINFLITASDADGDSLFFSAERLPGGATLIDHFDGTATFDWTPQFSKQDISLNSVIFYVTDNFVLYTEEIVTDFEEIEISVIEVPNEAPVLDEIGSKGIASGNNLNFDITASDPNGTTPYFTVLNLPAGATFIDNNNGSATFNWNTTVVDEGYYSVTFFTSDGEFVDSEVVSITIATPTNIAPVLVSIDGIDVTGDEIVLTVTEGDALEFIVAASDPDGDKLFLTAEQLPPGVIFEDNGNGTGKFTWTPTYVQSGYNNIIFYADDGALSVSKEISIIIEDAGNQPPVFNVAGPFVVDENEYISFLITASDPEGSSVSFPTNIPEVDFPLGLTVTDLGNDTALVEWIPTYCQSGPNIVGIVAFDGEASTPYPVEVFVRDIADQLPVLNPIGSQAVEENKVLFFTISTTIPFNCAIPSIGVDPNTMPSGNVELIDNGDGTGTFTWIPSYDQSGIYHIKFFADDGVLAADSEVVEITILEAGNQPPVFEPIEETSVSIFIGKEFQFIVKASDPENKQLSMTSSSLPSGAELVDSGNGVANLVWTPVDTGRFNIMFYADDGYRTDSTSVDFVVFPGSGKISLAGVDGLYGTSTDSILTCKTITFYINFENNSGTVVTDILNSFKIFSPEDILFEDEPDSLMQWSRVNGSFENNSQFFSNTIKRLASTGSDIDLIQFEGFGIPGLIEGYNDTLLAITIGPIDPAFAGRRICLDSLFGWKAPGIDNETPRWKWGKLIPEWDGPHYFTVVENTGANQKPTITVADNNLAVNLCDSLIFDFGISDPDGLPGYGGINLPEGAELFDNFDGTVTFKWYPQGSQDGTFNFSLLATDGCLQDTSDVQVVVTNLYPPVITSIGAQEVVACDTLELTITADTHGGSLNNISSILVSDSLEEGMFFKDNYGNATFRWIPTGDQAGDDGDSVYAITFYIQDVECQSLDSEVVLITVNENLAPTLEAIADKTIKACDTTFKILMDGNDTEGLALTYSYAMADPSESFPGGSNLIKKKDDDGFIFFKWIPENKDVGSYDLAFFANDNCGLSDTQYVRLTVIENTLPVINTIEYTIGGITNTYTGDTIKTAEDSLIFTISASDAEGQTIEMYTNEDQPDSSVFVDNGDGTAEFSFYPKLKGYYRISFFATEGCGADTAEVVISFNYDVPPGVHAVAGDLPDSYSLRQNYPNPFNPVTTIDFQIPTASHVRLEVYNVLGQRIKTLINNVLSRNRYSAEWNGDNDHGNKVSTGIYFYRLQTEKFVDTKKMMLIK